MAAQPSFETYSDLLPPQNIDAEESILGGILLDAEAIGRVADLITPEAFYLGAHRHIFEAMLDLSRRGNPTDLVTVTAWLRDRDLLDKIGGPQKLTELLDRTVSAVNIDRYAALVAEKHVRRKLIAVGGDIAQLAFDNRQDLGQLLDTAEQKLFGVTQSDIKQDLVSTEEILAETFLELESRSMDDSVPGLTCGFYDLDTMTQGFQRSDLVIVAGRPSMGKCLSADAQILLADGSLQTIGDIYRQKNATLLTLGQDWRFRLTQPSTYVDDGIKPVFKVKTRTGREIETTLTHPFLTIQGWMPLAELPVGTKIAVPRVLPVFGDERLPEHQVKLLAYLIGDGCLTGTSPQFTNENPQIQEEFTAAALQCSAIQICEEQGIWDQSDHQKTIPSAIFRLKKPLLALFLNRLFATDGWATVLAIGQAQLGFASVSETLARQVQHLLLRFGIVSQLKARAIKYQGGRRAAWQIDITDARSIKTFSQDIGIFGKEAALAKVEATLENRRYQTNRDLIPVEIWDRLHIAKGTESWVSLANRAGFQNTSNIHAGTRALSRDRGLALATALGDLELQQIATSEVYWDEIVAIEPQGPKQVYDLTIPETHNFVANDICVHNTSFVLNIARNLAAINGLPVATFSLEMSKEQLVYRLLSSEAQIETGRLRSGRISENEWAQIGTAINTLSNLKIFIDDTPNITVNEMRSKCRRLQAESGGALGMVILDYLQLMEGGGDNRVQELSKITRSLKGLARELNVPVLALSQLSRGVESRTDKRPVMSDLRECVTGDTLVCLADGRRVPIAELVGQTPTVISMNAKGKLISAPAEVVWEVGTKPIYELSTASGRKIKATEKHRIYTLDGWRSLASLAVGHRIAVANHIPQLQPAADPWPEAHIVLLAHLIGDGSYIPHQPLRYTTASEENSAIVTWAAETFGCTVNRHAGRGNWHQLVISGNGNRWHPAGVGLWLRQLGIFGQRSAHKHVPPGVFQLPKHQIALFLQHLWATDGCISSYHHPNGKSYKASIFFSTVSEALARDVAALLLRLGIHSTLKWTSGQCYTVQIYGKTHQLSFLEQVGAFGPRVGPAAIAKAELLQRGPANPNRDTIPIEVFDRVKAAMKTQGISQRRMAELRGTSFGGSSHFKFAPSREVLRSYAEVLQSAELTDLINSDLFWDEVVAIEPAGEAPVYDLTVPGPASWLADGLISHNSGSIEQDADLIVMLYREEYYNPDTPDRGISEVLIKKHRNGPTGTVKLLFEPQYTRFRNLAGGQGRSEY
ncbi:MAG: replicative DNA helicase [Cyanobacteria bacterium]|nr:replicative DNA helicase [Cyanobacteriota bacterium]